MAVVCCLGVVVLVLSGCGATNPSPADSAACGWDLSDEEGRRANSEYLSATVQWLADHPGQVPPEPTHPAWRGACPSAAPIPPPDDEHDHPE